jgi:excisionase family DNA binding protein
MDIPGDKQFLRVEEAADFLSVSRWTIYRWVEEGRLRGTKIGKGSLRIFHASVADLVKRNQVDNVGSLPVPKRSRTH